jgi:hypothetical protein
MSYCSYCNYFAPTNSRYQRHLNTNKHARNFMLVDAGIQDLVEQPCDETYDDLPDLIPIASVSDEIHDNELPDLIPVEPLCDEIQDNCINAQTTESHNDKSTSVDNLPELVDESTRDLAKSSFDITSSISQFFDDYPFAFHLLHVIGFFGLIFFKTNRETPPLVDSK